MENRDLKNLGHMDKTETETFAGPVSRSVAGLTENKTKPTCLSPIFVLWQWSDQFSRQIR